MLQYLIWGVCALILAVGHIAAMVSVLTVPAADRKKNAGLGVFAFYFIIAATLFVLSLLQGAEIQRLLGQ